MVMASAKPCTLLISSHTLATRPLEALDFEFVETAPNFFSLLSLVCEVKENRLGVLIPAFAARQKVEKIVHAEKLLAVRRLHAT